MSSASASVIEKKKEVNYDALSEKIVTAVRNGYRKTVAALFTQAVLGIQPKEEIDPNKHYDELFSLVNMIQQLFGDNAEVVPLSSNGNSALIMRRHLPNISVVVKKDGYTNDTLYNAIRMTVVFNIMKFVKVNLIGTEVEDEVERAKILTNATSLGSPIDYGSDSAIIKDSLIAVNDIMNALTNPEDEMMLLDVGFFFSDLKKKFGNDVIIKLLSGDRDTSASVLRFLLDKDYEMKKLLIAGKNDRVKRELLPMKILALIIAGTLPKYANSRGLVGYELNSVHYAIISMLVRFNNLDDEILAKLMKDDNKLKYLVLLKKEYMKNVKEFGEYMALDDYYAIKRNLPTFVGLEELQIRLGAHSASVKYEGNILKVFYYDHNTYRAKRFIQALKRWGIADEIDLDNFVAYLKHYDENTIKKLATAMALTTSIDIQHCIDTVLKQKTLEKAIEARKSCVNREDDDDDEEDY